MADSLHAFRKRERRHETASYRRPKDRPRSGSATIGPAMVGGDLLSLIKAKQAQLAKLHAELEEAQALLATVLNEAAPSSGTSDARRRRARRRSTKMLEHSPTARDAAKALRAAGRPLHATTIAKIMKRNGRTVALGTLVSTLSRWVKSRSVFYRERPNVFGLITLRERSGSPRRAAET